MGIGILMKACEAPLRQIAENAGCEGSIIVQKVKETGEGWDAREERFGDLFKLGIVDPRKVVRLAMESASSIAGLLLTTEAIITDEPEEEKAAAAPAMGGGMGGMGGF